MLKTFALAMFFCVAIGMDESCSASVLCSEKDEPCTADSLSDARLIQHRRFTPLLQVF